MDPAADAGGGRSRGRARVATVLSLAAAAVLVALSPGVRAAQTRVLPANLERYLATAVRPSASERALLLDGQPITKLLDADRSREIAVFGAIWISAPMERYVAAVNDIENFERGGGFRITRRISTPARPDDFAEMTLSDEDAVDLRNCRVGDCELKLGQASIDAIRARVNWSRPAEAKAEVERFFRQRAFEYVTEYRARGNAGLAVYRDARHPTFVATEFASMIDRLPALAEYLPDLRRYLLEYPKVTLASSTDFFYWQEAQFGLKPTIRINHVVIQRAPSGIVVASKMLYASHYFWTGLEVRVLVADAARGQGFWFITVSRTRSDGLSGFVGRLIGGRVRSEVQKGALAGLTATKALMER